MGLENAPSSSPAVEATAGIIAVLIEFLLGREVGHVVISET